MIDQTTTFIEACVRYFRGQDWLSMFPVATLDRVEQRIRDDIAKIGADQNLTLVKFDVDRDGYPPDPCIDIVYNVRNLDGTVYVVVGDERPRGAVEYDIMRDDDVIDGACTAEGKPRPHTMQQVMKRIDP